MIRRISFLLVAFSTIPDQIFVSAEEKSPHTEMCKANEDFAQKPDSVVTSNGCSKPSFLQVGGEEDFTYCCDRHDACYSICGAPKAFCDDDFKHCMLKLCSSTFKNNKECPSAAQTYAMGTMMFGMEGYHESQRDVCVCVERNLLHEHYTSLVKTFYEIHAPERSEKAASAVDTYIAKQKDIPGTQATHRYSKLLYELHKKYDQAIVHIKGRIAKGQNIPRPQSSKKEL